MDINIKLAQLSIICRALTCLGLSADDVVYLYEYKNFLYISATSDSTKITVACNTNVEIAKSITVPLNSKDFIAYISYISGFKLGGDVILRFEVDKVVIKYKSEGINNYIYLPHTSDKLPFVSSFKIKYSIDLSLGSLSNDLPKAVVGTSSSIFTNAFNGIIIFKNDGKTYTGGTDTVKCVIIPTDILLPDKLNKVNLTTSSVNMFTAISKLTGLPCKLGITAKKFKAEIGNFTIYGPLPKKTAPIESLIGISGVRFVIDRKVFLNAVKGSMQASKKDIYRAIDISLESDYLRLKNKDFEVSIKGLEPANEYVKSSFNSVSLYSICALMSGDELLMELSDTLAVFRDGTCTAYLSPINK